MSLAKICALAEIDAAYANPVLHSTRGYKDMVTAPQAGLRKHRSRLIFTFSHKVVRPYCTLHLLPKGYSKVRNQSLLPRTKV